MLRSRVVELERQLDWFRRQIFGQTSERRIVASETQAQLPLAAPAQPLTPPPALERVGAHTRRKAQAPERDDSGLFFDASKVPLERIELANPQQLLKPAMFAKVELQVGAKAPVLTVPDSAVIDSGRIVDLKYQSNSPSVSVHLTYGAFNTAVVVTPPPTV